MKKGFTIIETMLVLSISALFAVGLMIGWSVNINRQRYEDAVNTFKSDIQAVFNEVENPKNSAGRVACVNDRLGSMLNTDTTNTSTDRGTTNCIILGKIIMFDQVATLHGDRMHNTEFKIYNLVWDDSIDLSHENNHMSALSRGVVSIDFNSEEIKNLEWGANIKMVTDNRNGAFKTGYRTSHGTLNSILIIRSPLDGSILVFGSDGLPNNKSAIDNMKKSRRDSIKPTINEGALLNDSDRTFNICIRNTGASKTIGGEAIYGRNKILKIGNSSSSIQVAPLDGDNGSSCGNSHDWSDIIINGRAI